MMMTEHAGAIARLCALVLLLAAAPATQTVSAQDVGAAKREYVVRPGDTLFSIARRFETTVDALRQTNRLTGDQIQVGQTLIVSSPQEHIEDAEALAVPPADTQEVDTMQVLETAEVRSPGAAADDSTESVAAAELGFIYVGRGQSLYDVAFATGLPVDSLLALNPDVDAFLPDSARLMVPAEYASVRYTVKSGDTLFRIARALGTTIDAIRSANQTEGDVIRIGQVLTVPSARLTTRRAAAALPIIAEGEVRVYPERFVGRLTASGRPYDPDAFTVSHGDLPIGSIVLVSVPGADRRTFAEVSDRLPGSAQYLMDASEAVMRVLRSDEESNLRVELRVLRYGRNRQ